MIKEVYFDLSEAMKKYKNPIDKFSLSARIRMKYWQLYRDYLCKYGFHWYRKLHGKCKYCIQYNIKK